MVKAHLPLLLQEVLIREVTKLLSKAGWQFSDLGLHGLDRRSHSLDQSNQILTCFEFFLGNTGMIQECLLRLSIRDRLVVLNLGAIPKIKLCLHLIDIRGCCDLEVLLGRAGINA